MTARILVTGSRGWNDWDTMAAALMAEYSWNGPLVVVHGQAPGADTMASKWVRWAANRHYPVVEETHPADWEAHCSEECWRHRKKRRSGVEYCPRQGGIRNGRMVSLGASVCLAFPTAKSVGTFDCIRQARRAHIPVRNFGPEPPW